MSFVYAADQAASGGWTAQATATLIGATVAFVVAALGLFQKWRADRRDHWWSRTQWALDQLDEGEEARTIAIEVLSDQLDSRLAEDADWQLLDRAMQVVLNDFDGADR